MNRAIVILCKFNNQYELFLQALYGYCVIKFGRELNLSALHTIEMVEKLPFGSDGRMIDEHTIHISSRLYETLPVFEIAELHENKNFQTLTRTLFHELCHINERSIMLQMHNDYSWAFYYFFTPKSIHKYSYGQTL